MNLKKSVLKLICIISDLKNQKIVMKTLLKYDADLNVVEHNDKTTLMIVNFNVIDIEQLIMYNVDLNSTTIHT